jgi:hypothetical protein
LHDKIRDGNSCVEVAPFANSLFLRSFEEWVSASMACSEKGSSVKERAARIKLNFEKAIKGNIQYHTEMSQAYVDAGDKDSAAMHLAMAQAYGALIKQ